MNLAKKDDVEVMQVYDTWLNSYLNGDIKTYDSFLDDDYRFIGSTNNEEFLNRKDTTSFFKATADQFAGKTELRNSVRTVKGVDGLIFITHLFDAYFLDDNEWTYYGRFRFTSALRKKENEWKFIYQHFSMPDSKAQDGETIGYEKVAAENIQLKDAIRRRTIELENKNRELEIETSLERVRTVAMGMNKPDDLVDICAVLFKELQSLGFTELRRTLLHTYVDDQNYLNDYDYSDDTGPGKSRTPYTGHPVIERFVKEIRSKKDAFSEIVITGEELTAWKKFRIDNGQTPDPKLDAIPALYYYNYAVGPASIGISTFSSISNDKRELLKRFRNVFDFAYRRYLDVAQAEAQAREAQIEAALERVRSRTMAMHRTDELLDAAELIYKELSALGIASMNVSYAFVDQDEKYASYYSVNPVDGKTLTFPFIFPHTETDVMRSILSSWKKQEPFNLIELDEDATLKHQTYIGKHILSTITKNNIGIPFSVEAFLAVSPKKAVIYSFNFSKGYLFNIGGVRLTQKQEELVLRFTKVFEQTYTRFLDLQKAEAQAREAKIETALERVRARALAMQEPEELKEVAKVLRTEMGLLGVEELEGSSIFIYDKKDDNAECWFAIKDNSRKEKKLVADYIPLDLKATKVGCEMYKFFNSDDLVTSIPMIGADRHEWIRYCYKLSPLLDGFYDENIPDRTYHLYKFSHGAIGAAATGDISEESWRMLNRAASVFSLAYSRFKDLTQARTDLIKLKEEKNRAEDALTELQVTQKQLIQAEKMASLGELTAGIAHEIQNPLNFVNNFSEVSTELLDEMKMEVDKGNYKEVVVIANDVKQNLEKILHHGKRADGIVKGMLQHSKASSGRMEPTDINVLADEYFRLAYHGLRAKDKSFNATMKTDFDESIGNMNVIPQDLGRVILNLISNAFYSVTEKKKQLPDFEPIVRVSSKNTGGMVELSVKDNGSGIPRDIVDKIFQPFFTTKPTGQGTGLGLSLSYDIVKAHGGELKVDTKEGVGTEFIIALPVNT